MSKVATIFFHNQKAGTLMERPEGYRFVYNAGYLNRHDAQAISNTLPLQKEPYLSNVLFPFFDGLIPEGWLLHLAEENWKLKERDRFELLLVCCKNCIGAVSVMPASDEEL